MEDEDFYEKLRKFIFNDIESSKSKALTPTTESTFKKEKFTPGGLPINSHFGTRWGQPHQGIDISGKTQDGKFIVEGTPIYYNGTDGVVTYAAAKDDGSGFGKNVRIKNSDGSNIICGHFSNVTVSKNQTITQGTQIGNIGNTGHSFGAHLHFEYRAPGSNAPIDPYQYVDQYVKF